MITASLTNDLFSFEKEKGDTNVQNSVLVVMREHSCSEEEAREICRKRIRIECANYARVVKDIRKRTDLSEDVKRYIENMQYTLSGNFAWSTQCPRYNAGAKFNELQLLRAKHGLKKYPAMWPPKDTINGSTVKTERKEPLVNGNVQGDINGVDDHSVGHYESIKVNGHKRKRNGNSPGEETSINGTHSVKKSAHLSQPSTDSLVPADVVSLALDWDLPDLSDNVS